MFLRDILNKSTIAFTATISGEESINKLEKFRPYTEDIVQHFPRVIIASNSLQNVSADIIKRYHDRWLEIAPNCVILHSDINRGHMFGTIDLEESILTFIKENYPEAPYLWKSADDVVVSTDILDIEVPEVDFYYLPGFSYETILRAGSKDNLLQIIKDEAFESGLWTPQTPFFILNCHDVRSLYGDDVQPKIDFYQDKKRDNPSIKPWEIPFDIKFDCETHLGRTVKDLSKYCLVEDVLQDLIDFVWFNKVGDPSHKGLYFNNIGVCHYHYWKSDYVYKI